MNARMKIAAPLLLAATAALAATGFAHRTTQVSQAQPPASEPYAAPSAQQPYAAPAADETASMPAANDRSMAPAVQYRSRTNVTVTAPRPSDDELLRNAVTDRLSNDAALSGKIGVEAYRHTVSLTGRVTTTNQVERAGMLARSIDGVWDVNNYVLARVGQS